MLELAGSAQTLAPLVLAEGYSALRRRGTTVALDLTPTLEVSMTGALSSDVRRAYARSFNSVSPALRALAGPTAMFAAAGLMGAVLAPRRARPAMVFASGAAMALLALRWARARASSGPLRFERAVTIARSPEEVFRFLTEVERWPRFSTRLTKVTPLAGGEFEWLERIAGRVEVRWSVELSIREADRSIAWEGLAPGMEERGTIFVSSAPGGRGSEVRAVLEYGGRLSGLRGLGQPLGRAPAQILGADLRNLKRILEVGEVITEGRPSAGRRTVAGVVAQEGGL